MKRKVLPIKDKQILKQVEDILLNKFQYGMRNYMIFQVGKVTLLRVSDVFNLHYTDVFDEQGKVKLNAYLNLSTALYLDPIEVDLVRYRLCMKPIISTHYGYFLRCKINKNI